MTIKHTLIFFASYVIEAAAVTGLIVLNHGRPELKALRLFSGIDGSPVVNISAGLNKLAKQISHTVQWAHCLEGCVEAGASVFFELGPGRALNEMAARAYPDISEIAKKARHGDSSPQA